ncbi:MAG: nuclease [Alphaproteobacteria bacterium]|nr:MAG: nuclease [Alphaproteobacteria bacterium]PZO35188.1 MAG: nuclease [Alphaproteobacteria bacterium]
MGVAACLLATASAAADPCLAALPDRPGQTFGGIVQYVGDGDSLCVGPTRDPRTWIEVRLADWDAAELSAPGGQTARSRLQRRVLGRAVRCIATRGRSGRVTVYDRVIALCRLGHSNLGDLLR